MCRGNPLFKSMYLETYFQDVIRGKRRGRWEKILLCLLRALSLPYQWAVRLRNRAYDLGWFKSYTPASPLVISVGNIVAGGTGKTPVTVALAKILSEKANTAVLSRGYRRKSSKLSSPLILQKEKGEMHSAHLAGDEPYLIAENVPKAMVIVGKDRVASAKLAQSLGAEVLILDDGFQHRRLERDFDVVVFDVKNLFGFNQFLPRGFLRDELKSLKRADLVVLNHIESQDDYLMGAKSIAKFTKAPVVGCRFVADQIFDLHNNGIEHLEGKKGAIFSGIANPETFAEKVRSIGVEIVLEKVFQDHAKFSFEELSSFESRALAVGAEVLVCTEKDRVKLLDFPAMRLPVLWIKGEIEVVEGKSFWEEFVGACNKSLRVL